MARSSGPSRREREKEEVGERIFNSTGLGDVPKEELREVGVTLRHLRDLFRKGFTDPTVTPNVRKAARDEWFGWTEELGLDNSEFDWQDWREFFEGDTP